MEVRLRSIVIYLSACVRAWERERERLVSCLDSRVLGGITHVPLTSGQYFCK